MGSPGNARTFAECDVLMHGGQLGETPQGLVCGRVVPPDGQEALRESRRQTWTLERFLHVPAPRVRGRLDRSGHGSRVGEHNEQQRHGHHGVNRGSNSHDHSWYDHFNHGRSGRH
jgi:hypothetical protein